MSCDVTERRFLSYNVLLHDTFLACHVAQKSMSVGVTLPVLAKPCNLVISKKPMMGNMMAVKALMGSQYSCKTTKHK